MDFNNKSGKSDSKNEDRPVVVRNTTDLQRLKLEKLMKNPEKPVVIPEKPKGRNMPPVPDFVRNVMGSSAGAGSGEFHVYRHLRRKEYARQKFIQEKSEREKLDDEYHDRIQESKKIAEEKTAKKRAKRQKKKLKAKQRGKKKIKLENSSPESSDKEDSDSENETEKTEDAIIAEDKIEECVQEQSTDVPGKPQNFNNTDHTENKLPETNDEDQNIQSDSISNVNVCVTEDKIEEYMEDKSTDVPDEPQNVGNSENCEDKVDENKQGKVNLSVIEYNTDQNMEERSTDVPEKPQNFSNINDGNDKLPNEKIPDENAQCESIITANTITIHSKEKNE